MSRLEPRRGMTADRRWLAAIWPFVRAWLPDAPARVVDIGCGPEGGFVPLLRSHGYDAIGIDPRAPAGEHYQCVEFEHAELPGEVEAVVASTSLHHVYEPATVIDRIASTLAPSGRIIVVEWASERFDERTAQWCFARLGPDDEAGWLHRRRDEWLASGRPWPAYLREWAEHERLHRGDELVRLLDERFERELLGYGPYFFPALADTSDAEEQDAIEAGEIRAARIDWVGVR
jgi:SAM-dependent methyltransferase